MAECRLYKISGIVQGVFYRANTQEVASKLGLTGWVRNTSDGGVECLACGESDVLDALEKWLWQGPPAAKVDGVEKTDANLQDFEDFIIRY